MAVMGGGTTGKLSTVAQAAWSGLEPHDTFSDRTVQRTFRLKFLFKLVSLILKHTQLLKGSQGCFWIPDLLHSTAWTEFELLCSDNTAEMRVNHLVPLWHLVMEKQSTYHFSYDEVLAFCPHLCLPLAHEFLERRAMYIYFYITHHFCAQRMFANECPMGMEWLCYSLHVILQPNTKF